MMMIYKAVVFSIFSIASHQDTRGTNDIASHPQRVWLKSTRSLSCSAQSWPQELPRLFSHTRTERSQGRGVSWPNGLHWQVNGTWVGHLHTGAPTPQLSSLYLDLIYLLLIIVKTSSHKRKFWEKINGCTEEQ